MKIIIIAALTNSAIAAFSQNSISIVGQIGIWSQVRIVRWQKKKTQLFSSNNNQILLKKDRLLKIKRVAETIFSRVPITFRFLTNKVRIIEAEVDLALK